MSNDREDLGYSKPAPDPGQSEMFGDAPDQPGERIKFPEKLAELERELAMRRRVYPRQVESGKMTQERADRQIRVLECMIEDYNVRPWPQTKDFVGEWREDAERITFMGVRLNRLHREELLAVVAYCKTTLEEIDKK